MCFCKSYWHDRWRSCINVVQNLLPLCRCRNMFVHHYALKLLFECSCLKLIDRHFMTWTACNSTSWRDCQMECLTSWLNWEPCTWMTTSWRDCQVECLTSWLNWEPCTWKTTSCEAFLLKWTSPIYLLTLPVEIGSSKKALINLSKLIILSSLSPFLPWKVVIYEGYLFWMFSILCKQ